jgi:RNA polymerase sigma factor (sigma-70 family)
VLRSLLSAADENARASAWEEFLREYSGVLLHAARALGGEHDAVMDRYAFVLDALRKEDCRRLRGYVTDGHGKFTTWLIVVARRLCLDEHRHRYGRVQGESSASRDQQLERRNLADLLGNELDLLALEAPAAESPDEALLRAERRTALERALAALEPSDRLLLRMRFEDDLSVPEIARLLGKGSPFRFYRRLDKLLGTLRSTLRGGGVDDAHP